MYKLQTIYRLQEKIIRDSSEISMIVHMNDDKELLETYTQLLLSNYSDKIQAKVIIKNIKKSLVEQKQVEQKQVEQKQVEVEQEQVEHDQVEHDQAELEQVNTSNESEYYKNINIWVDAAINFFKLFKSKYLTTVNESIINDCMKCIFNSGKLKFIVNF